MSTTASEHGPLSGITVLDLSRVLAGPWCSQILGDLGADVIKVEQPGQGDDTRKWGPPFLQDGSDDSAYYLCANRNKRSIAIDIAKPEGAALVRELVAGADIFIENFRVGGLAKYGLDYESLCAIKPDLIYCSVTGFGQDGPMRNAGGYDFLIQGMSGLMSVTGHPDDAPGGGPMKVGTPTSDLSTGLYAATSILAALHHRTRTGEGQMIDIALFDTQVALLAHQASNWMNGGKMPQRMGNGHANMVPYQDFQCADGSVLIALGNDRQFAVFAGIIGRSDLALDARFIRVADRTANRDALLGILLPIIAAWNAVDLIDRLRAAGLPVGQVNDIPGALDHEQIKARGLQHSIHRQDETEIQFLGFPAKLSKTPATYRHAPPRCGEDTARVLRERLGMDDGSIDALRQNGILAKLP
jgi:crotonobetainyl-CoA:carnitine CoA-transferase CaiB-like acyl-CoA transferase